MMRKVRCCWLLLLGLLAGCQPKSSVDSLPDVSQTLEAAGRRLSGSLSEGKLTSLATHAPKLLAALNARERDVLGRGYLRFQTRVSSPSARLWPTPTHAGPCSASRFRPGG
ncbi:MAG: hypothetical protein ABSE84_11130 [Isosphaeraceae bacterium]